MTRKELKQLIRETIMEEAGGLGAISPQVKAKMIQRLQNAIKHVEQSDDIETLTSLGDSEYDQTKGRFSVNIYDKRTDR